MLTRGSDNGAFFDGTTLMGALATARSLTALNVVLGNLTVLNDGTDNSTWPERLRFNYNNNAGKTRRTGYFNEFGELRSISALLTGCALRVYGKEFVGDGTRDPTAPIIEVSDDRDTRTRLFAVFSGGNAVFSGPVTAPNIGVKIGTLGPTAPGSPSVGDVWIDTT
jgi:hypothetical protein